MKTKGGADDCAGLASVRSMVKPPMKSLEEEEKAIDRSTIFRFL